MIRKEYQGLLDQAKRDNDEPLENLSNSGAIKTASQFATAFKHPNY